MRSRISIPNGSVRILGYTNRIFNIGFPISNKLQHTGVSMCNVDPNFTQLAQNALQILLFSVKYHTHTNGIFNFPLTGDKVCL